MQVGGLLLQLRKGVIGQAGDPLNRGVADAGDFCGGVSAPGDKLRRRILRLAAKLRGQAAGVLARLRGDGLAVLNQLLREVGGHLAGDPGDFLSAGVALPGLPLAAADIDGLGALPARLGNRARCVILADLARRNGFLFAGRLEGGLLIGDRLIQFGQFLFGCRANRADLGVATRLDLAARFGGRLLNSADGRDVAFVDAGPVRNGRALHVGLLQVGGDANFLLAGTRRLQQ